jgi:hypothetical protein
LRAYVLAFLHSRRELCISLSYGLGSHVIT